MFESLRIDEARKQVEIGKYCFDLSKFICVKTLPYDEARKQAEIGMCCFEPELLHLRLNHYHIDEADEARRQAEIGMCCFELRLFICV